MVKLIITFCLLLACFVTLFSQSIIPLDTAHWEIDARAYVLENYKGKDAIYLQGGMAKLKGSKFLNGTIEFDLYLTERQGFPGIQFRAYSPGNAESFYLRPHLSGKPDANQAAPVINGITPWQLFFGPTYSFPYEYNFNDWTHVKLVVNGDKAQVYLDNSEKPNFSWHLVHSLQEGDVAFGGGFAPTHYANFKINTEESKIIDFKIIEREPIKDLIPEWEISDMFEENQLGDPNNLKPVISSRKWGKKIYVEEGTAANISRKVNLYDGSTGNTVFAKTIIHSDKDQIKSFEFGYSDRVVVILNGKAIYKGTNKWRTRDYRYLGTIGLFDAVYLDLKKGENILLLAVSEDFGGWLVTGKLENLQGISLK